MSEAFYLPDGDRLVATELTRGPWSEQHQHGGPPSALLLREAERVAGAEPAMRTVRATIEILKPVPIAPVRLEAQLLRPGKRVQLIGATLAVDAAVVMRATVLRIRRKTLDVSLPPRKEAPVTPPDASPVFDFPFFRSRVGYHTAIDLRFGRGRFGDGDAAAWIRMLHPLVANEDPSPEQRILLAADAASGVSSGLDIRRYLFINADLTVHLHRPPAGEWICVDAHTIVNSDGIGIAESVLTDEQGPVGRGMQSLFVDTIA